MSSPVLTRRTALGLAAAFGLAPAVAAPARRYPAYGRVERLDPALDALIDPAAVAEAVLDRFVWSEGPVWVGGPAGHLLVSDPRTNIIARWNAADGGSAWLQPSGFEGGITPKLAEPGTNGLFLGRGGLVVADSGNRTLGTIDLATKKKSVIADRFEGKRFNSPNDLCISPVDGAVFFTDPPHGLAGGLQSPDREMDYTGVFRADRAGRITLIGRYDRPNGIGISPDGTLLYHTDGAAGWIVHRLDAAGRSVSERPFIDRAAETFTGASGDSLKVDAAGNVWLTGRDGVSIVAPSGRRIGIIRLDDTVSNCEIGADGFLYMSSRYRLARIRVKARKLHHRF